MSKIMVTLREAAAETGLSYYALRRLCNENEIKFVKSGNKFLVNRNFLLRYLGEPESRIQEIENV